MDVGANEGTNNASSQHRQGSLAPSRNASTQQPPLGAAHCLRPSISSQDRDQPFSTVQFSAFPGCFACSMTPMPLLRCLLSPSPYFPLISCPLQLPHPQKLHRSEGNIHFSPIFCCTSHLFTTGSHTESASAQDREKIQPGCFRFSPPKAEVPDHTVLPEAPPELLKCSCPLCRGGGHSPSPALEFCQEHRSSQCQIGFCGFSNVVCGFANVDSSGDIFSVSGKELDLQLW